MNNIAGALYRVIKIKNEMKLLYLLYLYRCSAALMWP